MMFAPWLIGLVFAALIAGLVVFLRARERKRTDAMAGACADMGFTFEARSDLEQFEALRDMPLFKRSRKIDGRNVMSGRVGSDPVTLFEYQYTSGAGEDQRTISQTVAVFPGGAPAWPDCQLSPENVFHKIGHVFGYQDINFESSPVFSKQYLLRGPDETAIRAAFYPETLEFFAQQPGWSVEARAETVAVYRAGVRQEPDGVRAFLDQAYAVIRAIRRL
jgi:hypothetical protein